MPTWLKVLLIVALVLVLLVVGVVVAGGFWWMRNKDALMSRAKEVVSEGQDFGSSTDNQGCVDESLSRYKKEPGFSNAISTAISCARVWIPVNPRQASVITCPEKENSSRAESGEPNSAATMAWLVTVTARIFFNRCSSTARNRRTSVLRVSTV